MVEDSILIVAPTEPERATLAELHRRAQRNGVQSRIVPAAEIPAIEPEARGVEALHAPEGASFDPVRYVEELLEDARAAGAEVRYDVAVRPIGEQGNCPRVATRGGAWEP